MRLSNRTFANADAALSALINECHRTPKQAVNALARAIPYSLGRKENALTAISPVSRKGRVTGISPQRPWKATAEIERIDRDTGKTRTVTREIAGTIIKRNRTSRPRRNLTPEQKVHVAEWNAQHNKQILANAKKRLPALKKIRTRGLARRIWRILSSRDGWRSEAFAHRSERTTFNSHSVTIASLLSYATRATSQSAIADAIESATRSEIKKIEIRLQKAAQKG